MSEDALFDKSTEQEVRSVLGDELYAKTIGELILEVDRAQNHFSVLRRDINSATALAHRIAGGAAMLGVAAIQKAFSQAEKAARLGLEENFAARVAAFYLGWPRQKHAIENALTGTH